MLWFERQVVATLVADLPDPLKSNVEGYVDGSLKAMPEHLRAGVAAQSLLFGATEMARRATRREPQRPVVETLECSRLALAKQYVRLLRSLALFAEHELAR